VPNFVKTGCDKNSLLNCLMETVHQGITVVDRNLDLLLVNEAAQSLLDIPLHVLQSGPNLEQLFRFNAERGDYGPGEPECQVRDRIEKARLFEPHDFERVRPNGIVLRVQGTPITGGGFVTIYSDVTRERRQEKELLTARQELSQRLDHRTQELVDNRDLLLNAINGIRDGLTIADNRGRIILANDKMKSIHPNITGYVTTGATVSNLISCLFPGDPEKSLEDIMDPDVPWQERCFPNGNWYRVAHSWSTDGGIISVYTEITEYKKQQSNLRRHADELVNLLKQEKQLTEMQREFVSMASHEFRTPLAIIDSNAQRIIRGKETLSEDKLLGRVGKIRESVSRMQYLINRFLDFSQTQAKGMELNRKRQPFRDAVQRICGNFADACATHNIEVDVSALPEHYDFDEKLVELCVENLLSNAVKYSPKASTVSIDGRADGAVIEIAITDQGVGIPEPEIGKVFDKYFRASTSSGIPGTGIGLNMAASAIELHEGDIHIDSKVGEGSRIVIRLPDKTGGPGERVRSATGYQRAEDGTKTQNTVR